MSFLKGRLPSVKNKIDKPESYGWRAKKKFQKTVFLWLAVGPAMLGYIVFGLYPNIISAYYSLLDWNGTTKATFIGLRNFKKLFTDSYIPIVIRNNLIITVVVPAVVIMLSLLLAYALTHKNFMEKKIYRNVFFIPNVLSTVIVALIFTFVFDGGFGLINNIMTSLGVESFRDFYWLGNESTALPALMVCMIWGGVGTYLIIFMNAMNAIPKTIYESAIIDGASNMTRLFKITIPLIWGVIKVSLLFYIIGLFKGYEFVMVMTNGGPGNSTNVIGLYMFNLAFGTIASGTGKHQYGYASAIGMVLFVILVLTKVLIDKFGNRDPVEY